MHSLLFLVCEVSNWQYSHQVLSRNSEQYYFESLLDEIELISPVTSVCHKNIQDRGGCQNQNYGFYLERALEEIQDQELSIQKVLKLYVVSRTTLQDKNKVNGGKIRCICVLNSQVNFSVYSQIMATNYFTRKSLSHITYEISYVFHSY